MTDTPERPRRPERSARERLFDVGRIYYEPAALAYPRAAEILAAFPDAERVEVPAHGDIPGLYGNEGNVADWVKIKRTVLVLGVKKSLSARPNERSADFIAPSHANGCGSACAYCVESGTLIETPKGRVPVEQIRDGDEVSTFDSFAGRLVPGRVSGTVCRSVGELIEIRVGPRVLCVTPEHPIQTRRGWVLAEHLTEDDEVLCDEDRTT